MKFFQKTISFIKNPGPDRKSLLITLLALFAVSIYLPFLLGGGLIVDDWGDVIGARPVGSFREAYSGWFPLFSNRPLAPLPIVLTTRLFGLWQYGYIAVNVGIYVAMLGLTSRILFRRMGWAASAIFFLTATCPVIAPVVVFSPINQLTATVSLFFWSLSLTFLDLYLIRPKWYWFLSIYFCLLYSFLTYEVILPLTTLNMLLPLIAVENSGMQMQIHGRTWRYFLKFVLPIILVLLAVFTWQKFIAPHYMTVYSRLTFDGLGHALIAVLRWLYAMLLKTPYLLATSLLHLPSIWLIFPLAFLGAGLAVLLKEPISSKSKEDCRRLLIVAGVVFLSSSSLYFLNGSGAQIGGYESRGMSSSWISAALFLACAVQFLQPKFRSQKFGLCLFLIGGLIVHSFCVQRDNYIESWKEQNLIIDDIISQAHAKGLEAGQIVVGDVPYHLQDNYNNEIVFSEPWDFGSALILKSDHLVKDGAVVNKEIDRRRHIKISGDELILGDWWHENINVLWYYRFDPITKTGTLTKIHDAEELRHNVTALLN